MQNPIDVRHKKIASYSKGIILDIGYADHPNKYLKGTIIGLDLLKKSKPINYSSVVVGNAMNCANYFKSRKFDTIIAAELIEHLENPSQFLRETGIILKNQGRLIISTPNPYHLPTIFANAFYIRPPYTAHKTHDPYHINLFPYRNMITLLEYCDFKLEKVVNGNGLIINPQVDKGPIIPFFKAFSQDFIYIIKKLKNK